MSDLDRLKTHVTDAVDRMAEDLWSLALQIHANPELGKVLSVPGSGPAVKVKRPKAS